MPNTTDRHPHEFVWTDELIKEFIATKFMVDAEDNVFKYIQGQITSFKESKDRKPLFTTEDGVEIFHEDKYYPVFWDFTMIKSDENHMIAQKNAYLPYRSKLFSTLEKAKEYILINKPCLSVNDVKEYIERYFDYPNGINVNQIKELAKQKINP